MKSRSFFSILSGVVLVLVLIGAVGAYRLMARPPAPLAQKTSSAQPTATMFVPRQSVATVSLLINPARLETLWAAGATQRKTLKAELNQLQQGLFSTLGLDYDRDLKAWVGDEVTFALTSADMDRDASNGTQPAYLLALAVNQPQAAQTALQNFWQRRGSSKDLVTESFAGVPIVYLANTAVSTEERDTEPNLTSAVVGNQYVLFSNSVKVLRAALNSVQVPALSLNQSFAYQQALEQFSGQRLGFIFANVAQLQPWLQRSFLAPSFLAPLSGVSNPGEKSRYDNLVVNLEPDAKGILANALLTLAEPGSQPSSESTVTDSTPLLKFMPTGSAFAVAGQNLPQTWQRLEESWLAQLPLMARLRAGITDLEQQWGIDFAETVFNWVKEDYALAQIPRTDRAQPDWLFVTQRSSDTAAGLAQLDQIAQRQGASIGSFLLGDQTIEAWTKLSTAATKSRSDDGNTALQADVQGVHTTVGAYELMATSLEALEQALQTAQSKTAPDFQVAVEQLRLPNQGYLYFDQKTLNQVLSSQPGLESLKPLVRSLQSTVVSSYGTDGTGLRGAAFLHLNGL